jgi:O-acetyl-ADP-ribose deacetylase (regulator of RNase III)
VGVQHPRDQVGCGRGGACAAGCSSTRNGPPARRQPSCYRASLDLARQHGVRSIAFPAISCGAYRFPIDRAARIAIATIRDALTAYEELESLVIAAFDPRVEAAFRRALSAAQ